MKTKTKAMTAKKVLKLLSRFGPAKLEQGPSGEKVTLQVDDRILIGSFKPADGRILGLPARQYFQVRSVLSSSEQGEHIPSLGKVGFHFQLSAAVTALLDHEAWLLYNPVGETNAAVRIAVRYYGDDLEPFARFDFEEPWESFDPTLCGLVVSYIQAMRLTVKKGICAHAERNVLLDWLKEYAPQWVVQKLSGEQP